MPLQQDAQSNLPLKQDDQSNLPPQEEAQLFIFSEKIVKLSFGHINKDATRNLTHSTTGYILRLNRLLITQDHHVRTHT